MRRKTKQNILLCAAAKGSLWTRLSFIIMGAGCIRYKQYIRGLIYFLIQIGFSLFFKNFALQYLSKFNTLGTETQRKVWNEELQIFQRFPGDNSMLILLYSVLSLAVVVVFLYIWYASIRDSWRAQVRTEQGLKIDSFRDDLRSLTHERFHMTLLSMPMLTMVLFTVLPTIFMILIAFTNFDADHQPPGNLFTWVGMTNVTDIFLGNETKTNTFFGLLGWTIVWAILATFTNYILGMLLAVAINSKLVKLKQVWRTCFIMQSIDRSYFESAILDGATWLDRTRYITIPAITPIISPAVIITVFTTFKQFDVVYLLTQQAGAKTGSGFHTILTYAYENAFITNNYGYSSAISIIIFILLLVLSAKYQMKEEGER